MIQRLKFWITPIAIFLLSVTLSTVASPGGRTMLPRFRGPVQKSVEDIPPNEVSVGPIQSNGEISEIFSSKVRPGPFINVALQANLIVDSKEVLTSSTSNFNGGDRGPQGDRIYKFTHDPTVTNDCHSVKVKPVSDSSVALNVHKQRKKDFVEAKIVTTGKIEKDIDDIIVLIWDGYSNPTESTLTLPAGSKEKADTLNA